MEPTKRKYKKHKTDYKVGVTYFIDETKKPLKRSEREDVYPIYISIRVKRLTTNIRSRINIYTTKKNLQNTINSSDLKDFVTYETKLIEDTIRVLKPDQNDDFTIQEWHEVYSHGAQYLWFSVVEGLNYRLREHLVSNLNIVEAKEIQFSINSNPYVEKELINLTLILLEALRLRGDEIAGSILNDFKILIDKKLYETQISGIMFQELTLLDYVSGFYKENKLKDKLIDETFYKILHNTLTFSESYQKLINILK